jgi:hypothetical protein
MPATTRPVTTQARTYATYYMVDVNGQRGHDQVLFHHPNGLCVVCLSERHPMCTGGDTTSRDRGGPSTGGGEKRKREDGAEDAGIAGAADAGGAAETAEGGSEGGQQAETETETPLPAAAPGVVASYGAVAEADFRWGRGYMKRGGPRRGETVYVGVPCEEASVSTPHRLQHSLPNPRKASGGLQ